MPCHERVSGPLSRQLIAGCDRGRIWIGDAYVCSRSLLAFGAPARTREAALVALATASAAAGPTGGNCGFT